MRLLAFLDLRTQQRFRLNKKRIRIIIVAIWVVSFAALIPNYASFRYSAKDAVCYRNWPVAVNGPAFIATTSFIFTFLPIILFTVNFLKAVVSFRNRIVPTSESRYEQDRRILYLLGGLIGNCKIYIKQFTF